MAAKKTPASIKTGARAGNIIPNMEDKVFKALVKRYTKYRAWDMVEDLLEVYGHILEDREFER